MGVFYPRAPVSSFVVWFLRGLHSVYACPAQSAVESPLLPCPSFNAHLLWTPCSLVNLSTICTAMNSIALHTLQWLGHLICCNEFYCFSHITVIGLSQLLQRIPWLYSYYSLDYRICCHEFYYFNWIIAVVCKELYFFTRIALIGSSLVLQWILFLYAHCSGCIF